MVYIGNALVGIRTDGNNVLAANFLRRAGTDTNHIIGRHRVFHRTLAHGNITPCAVGVFTGRFANGNIRFTQRIGTFANSNRLIIMRFTVCTNSQARRAGSGRVRTQSHIALARRCGR